MAENRKQSISDKIKSINSNAMYNYHVNKAESLYASGTIDDTEYADILNEMRDRYEGPTIPQPTTPQQKPVQFSMDDFKTPDEISAMESIADDVVDTASNSFDFSDYNVGTDKPVYDFSIHDDIQEAYLSNDISSTEYESYMKSLNKKPPEPVGDIEYPMTGDGYSVNIKNGAFDNIEVDDMVYKVKDDQLHNLSTGAIAEGDELAKVNNIMKQTSSDYYKKLTNEDWSKIVKNPEKFGLPAGMTEDQILQLRRSVWSNETDRLRGELGKEGITNNMKKDIQAQLDKAQLNEAEVDKFISINKHKTGATADRQAARARFKEATEGLEYGSQEYTMAAKELSADFKRINKNTERGIANTEKVFAGKEKAFTGKGLSFGKVLNTGFSIKMGVDKYKEERAEGKSVISSAAQGLGSVAVAEMLGPVGQIAYEVAKAAPAAIMTGADALYKEHRRMNSASNFRPLGGVNYQDTQELATMRQSGMELAKMSQYNLEQTLMGAEAKHLHR